LAQISVVASMIARTKYTVQFVATTIAVIVSEIGCSNDRTLY